MTLKFFFKNWQKTLHLQITDSGL